MKALKPLIVTAAVVCLILVSTTVLYARKASEFQPINFSHKVHTSMLECDTCHRYYMERTVAGRPTVEICTGCHSEAENKEQEKILSYAEQGKEIPWRRVYKLPDYVFFSHRRHVAVGKVECSTCHGMVKDMDTPLVKPLVKIKMNFCISCHKENKVTKDCNACHR